MSETPKRPDVYDYPPGLDGAYQHQIELTEYYKAALSVAVEALERLASSEAFDMSRMTTTEERMRMEYADKALSTIKGSQS